MSIKGNVGQPALNLMTSDTIVIDFSDRVAVTSFSIFNKSGANRVVDIYESPDATIAAGKKIATYTLATLTSADVAEVIGQGYPPSQNIIAIVDTGATGDVNAKVTYTQYTGSS